MTRTFLCAPECDELGAYSQRVGEAGARGREIESPRILRSEAILNQAGRGRKQHIRGNGGDNNKLDFLRVDIIRFQEFSGRFRAEMGRSHAGIGIMALANTGARANPFIVRVHALFEIEIRDYARRNVSRNACNFRCNTLAHSHPVKM